MSFAGWNGVAARVIAGLVVLSAAAGTAAPADPTTLICKLNFPGGAVVEDEPTTIDLNEAADTVVVHFGPMHTEAGGYHALRAFTLGPLSATFGAQTITFSGPRGRIRSIA
ncbi:MAG: hypothetical protein ACREEB_12745 [Caulobacteraceae bacterium]